MLHASSALSARVPFPGAGEFNLTDREAECLTWVARGKSARDVGTILAISQDTVNYHLKKVGAKFGFAGRIQMVVLAVQQHLIEA